MFGKSKKQKEELAKKEIEAVLKEVFASSKQVKKVEKYNVSILFKNGNEARHNNVRYVDREAYFSVVYKFDGAQYSYPNKDILRIKQTQEV